MRVLSNTLLWEMVRESQHGLVFIGSATAPNLLIQVVNTNGIQLHPFGNVTECQEWFEMVNSNARDVTLDKVYGVVEPQQWQQFLSIPLLANHITAFHLDLVLQMMELEPDASFPWNGCSLQSSVLACKDVYVMGNKEDMGGAQSSETASVIVRNNGILSADLPLAPGLICANYGWSKLPSKIVLRLIDRVRTGRVEFRGSSWIEKLRNSFGTGPALAEALNVATTPLLFEGLIFYPLSGVDTDVIDMITDLGGLISKIPGDGMLFTFSAQHETLTPLENSICRSTDAIFTNELWVIKCAERRRLLDILEYKASLHPLPPFHTQFILCDYRIFLHADLTEENAQYMTSVVTGFVGKLVSCPLEADFIITPNVVEWSYAHLAKSFTVHCVKSFATTIHSVCEFHHQPYRHSVSRNNLLEGRSVYFYSSTGDVGGQRAFMRDVISALGGTVIEDESQLSASLTTTSSRPPLLILLNGSIQPGSSDILHDAVRRVQVQDIVQFFSSSVMGVDAMNDEDMLLDLPSHAPLTNNSAALSSPLQTNPTFTTIFHQTQAAFSTVSLTAAQSGGGERTGRGDEASWWQSPLSLPAIRQEVEKLAQTSHANYTYLKSKSLLLIQTHLMSIGYIKMSITEDNSQTNSFLYSDPGWTLGAYNYQQNSQEGTTQGSVLENFSRLADPPSRCFYKIKLDGSSDDTMIGFFREETATALRKRLESLIRSFSGILRRMCLNAVICERDIAPPYQEAGVSTKSQSDTENEFENVLEEHAVLVGDGASEWKLTTLVSFVLAKQNIANTAFVGRFTVQLQSIFEILANMPATSSALQPVHASVLCRKSDLKMFSAVNGSFGRDLGASRRYTDPKGSSIVVNEVDDTNRTARPNESYIDKSHIPIQIIVIHPEKNVMVKVRQSTGSNKVDHVTRISSRYLHKILKERDIALRESTCSPAVVCGKCSPDATFTLKGYKVNGCSLESSYYCVLCLKCPPETSQLMVVRDRRHEALLLETRDSGRTEGSVDESMSVQHMDDSEISVIAERLFKEAIRTYCKPSGKSKKKTVPAEPSLRMLEKMKMSIIAKVKNNFFAPKGYQWEVVWHTGKNALMIICSRSHEFRIICKEDSCFKITSNESVPYCPTHSHCVDS